MRRVLKLLFVMCTIYIAIQIAFKLVEKGYQVEYKIVKEDNNFTINETYTRNVKNEKNNYYFNIIIGDNSFNYQTFENFNMQNKIIKDIKYFSSDNYVCILPIFTGNKILSDIICEKDNQYYFYHDIKNTNANLDSFAVSLEEIGYNASNYADNTDVLISKSSITAYKNILKNHFLGLENYKGLYTLNDRNSENIYNSSMFSKDIYTKSISAFAGKYYVVADYTKDYKFNEFKVIDITTNAESTISYDYDINMDSYVQGVIGNSIYIFDRSTLKQYELDIKDKTIVEVGNTEVGIKKYINSSFETINAYDAKNSDIKFSEYTTDNIWNGTSYAKVDKTGISKSGYYYIYEQSGDNYKVYRSNIQSPTTMIYLYTTDNILNAVYIKNCIYYRDGKYIKRYSDTEGVKTILENSELEFNTSLKFNVYIK